MIELFDVVLVKYTGLAGRATEVNSISYKTVDSAVYLDSIDALNYPVRAPYGTTPKTLSYENWTRFKLRLNMKYRKFLSGTSLHLPCESCHPDDNFVYTKIKNPRLWLKFKCFDGYEIKYGVTDQYIAPTAKQSQIAVNNIRQLQNEEFNFERSLEFPLGTKGEILIGELDNFESDFLVTQLTAFKGCQFQNTVMKIELHYDLA